MDCKRVKEILRTKEKCDVFFNDRPIWIQSIDSNMAKIGFIDNFEEKNGFIEDLYEAE